jgi:hypothetical protein
MIIFTLVASIRWTLEDAELLLKPEEHRGGIN